MPASKLMGAFRVVIRKAWRRGWDSNPRMEVLQTSPLGHLGTAPRIFSIAKSWMRVRATPFWAVGQLEFFGLDCGDERKFRTNAHDAILEKNDDTFWRKTD